MKYNTPYTCCSTNLMYPVYMRQLVAARILRTHQIWPAISCTLQFKFAHGRRAKLRKLYTSRMDALNPQSLQPLPDPNSKHDHVPLDAALSRTETTAAMQDFLHSAQHVFVRIAVDTARVCFSRMVVRHIPHNSRVLPKGIH